MHARTRPAPGRECLGSKTTWGAGNTEAELEFSFLFTSAHQNGIDVFGLYMWFGEVLDLISSLFSRV